MKARTWFHAQGQRRGATGMIAGIAAFIKPEWAQEAYLQGWRAGRLSVGLPVRPVREVKRINPDTFFAGRCPFIEKVPMNPTVREWGK
jgi:hypothetical protein